MRRKNSKAITHNEHEHLALVKMVGCVFCDDPAYVGWAGGFATEAHHPYGCQGLHWLAISACHTCHCERVWTFGGMTEAQAANETLRRVDELRRTARVTVTPHTKSRQHPTRTPSKIIPRNAAHDHLARHPAVPAPQSARLLPCTGMTYTSFGWSPMLSTFRAPGCRFLGALHRDDRSQRTARRRAARAAGVGSMTFRVTIGCDPGQSGALAVLADGEPIGFIDMPTMPRAAGGHEVNGAELAAVLRGVLKEHCGAYIIAIVEAVSAMPGQGGSSMFRFGESFGKLKGVLEALGVPYKLVHPQVWKRKLALIGQDKDAARTAAIRLFPSIADQLARKKDVGRADAALIAHWAHVTEQVAA